MWIAIAIGAVIFVIILAIIGMYNNLVSLKMKVKKLYQKIGEVLQDREKMIIELRFGLNGRECKTQNQIAKELGISRSYVSRIETKAINKLSREFKE